MTFDSSYSNMRQTIDLNGQWTFALDPNDVGLVAGWQRRTFETVIRVPGSWEEQGFGTAPASHPLGTWSKHHQYEGAAWYSGLITIPSEWSGKRVHLRLAGARWRTEVWLDGQPAGEEESLSTPHVYDLTSLVRLGSTQRLTIRVDNRMIYPLKESHIHSDHTGTRWGGITGGAQILALPKVTFEKIICRPNVDDRSFDFHVHTSGEPDLVVDVTVTDPQTKSSYQSSAASTGGIAAVSVRIGALARLWWDDDPFLYDVVFTLRKGDIVLDRVQQRVGLREIAVDGKQLLLNGQPVFLRGYVDCCIFPHTGYPVWDIEHYRRQFGIAKSYGFNHVRLHSWTAPEPFWQAADEAGMLVQTELPHWSRFYDRAETEPPQEVHHFLESELERIVEVLHLHPSWVLFSAGNELLGGGDEHPRLAELVERGKQLDPTRLYTDNTGFGQIPSPGRKVDFYIQSCNWHPPKKIYDAASSDTTQNFSAITALADAPVIGHEHGQFTMYVRPQEAEKYHGVIRPSWLESIRDSLDSKGMTGSIDAYIQASGTHMLRTYKENIERARRTRDLAGFQLLDIRDFPGQGHATTGILDVFWDSKGLVEPETFAEFNSAVTLLMRAPTPTFYNGATLGVVIDVSNFGRSPLPAGPLRWKLGTADMELHGHIDAPQAPAGALTVLGYLDIALPDDDTAHRWELSLEFGGARNRWHVWSYPYPRSLQSVGAVATRLRSLRPALPGANYSDDFTGIGIFTEGALPESQLAISDRLTGRVLQYLYDGGSVWLMPGPKELHDAVPTRYLPPFWSYLWFPDNVSSVMGMLVHEHPALARFPHDSASDWQWYSLVNDAPAICLDAIPFIEPIVEVIDNFSRAKRLAYAFEAQVGTGRLFVSTWRLLDANVMVLPEARFLLSEVIRYLLGDTFKPARNLSVGQMLAIFRLSNGIELDFE